MKLHVAVLALSFANADAFVSRTAFRPTTSLSAAAAATTFEEDLELTVKAIFKHVGNDMSKGGAPGVTAVAPKPAATAVVQEPEKAATLESDAATVDLSIPYDAAARLEFDASNKKFDAKKFEAFKEEYYTKTVAMVTAKKAARDSASTPAAPSKAAPAKTAAAPKAASSIDIAVDYDAPAKLAFTQKFCSFDEAKFPEFRKAYLAGAVAMVTAKQQVRNGNISVPYDAAARLAFMTASDNVFDEAKYAKFKEEFEAKAVAEVSAKHKK
ncbi:hypothetical protein MPSEU_000939900 [Mayamaea pseudoterrestris]|nr:hypothetical protein MPSEU_000939900 [Mayamaea pseudoterrestris]